MACQAEEERELARDEGQSMVYVNKVGTFGLSPASYWRVGSAWYLMGEGYPLELLLYADDLEVVGLGAKGRQGIPMCYLLLATRGGFRVEWLGMETDYVGDKLGLSKRRADWLVEWLRGKVAASKVSATEMSRDWVLQQPREIGNDWHSPALLLCVIV